ncbi:hypothetical protein GCM10009551_101030 [Nocardiopsis tropica]|uniref:hypothetical protein n=1 Tax=Tsukamurella strandjordii TaxID=147577 RepID=UPI0031D249B0
MAVDGYLLQLLFGVLDRWLDSGGEWSRLGAAAVWLTVLGSTVLAWSRVRRQERSDRRP